MSDARGSTIRRLYQDWVLTENTVVDRRVLLEFINGAKIVSNGFSLTFEGVGIYGRPIGQIFSGFTFDKLVWVNATPELYIEWFGGQADNVIDNKAALELAVRILSVSKANGRRGGVIRFLGGIYRFTPVELDDVAFNIRFEGNGTKAISFGSNADTVLLGSFSLRSAQGLHFNNLGICYASAFNGDVINLSTNVNGTKGIRFTNCLLGSLYTPDGTLYTTAACIVNLAGAYDCSIIDCTIIGGQIGIRCNPAVSPQDGNAITIERNEISHCLQMGIANLHQQANICNNNFEGTNMVSAANGGLPYAISYDYPDPANAVIFGLRISGNWFGDRTTFGRAYIRLPRTKGADISGNFFGGGYNNATDFNSAAIEIYHGSTVNVAGNFFGGGHHCVKFTLADGGNALTFHGNSTQYAEQSVTNPNDNSMGQKVFNAHNADVISTIGSQ